MEIAQTAEGERERESDRYGVGIPGLFGTSILLQFVTLVN
jgi:hypothetical protein